MIYLVLQAFFKILITFERIIQVKYCFHVININKEEPR